MTVAIVADRYVDMLHNFREPKLQQFNKKFNMRMCNFSRMELGFIRHEGQWTSKIHPSLVCNLITWRRWVACAFTRARFMWFFPLGLPELWEYGVFIRISNRNNIHTFINKILSQINFLRYYFIEYSIHKVILKPIEMFRSYPNV